MVEQGSPPGEPPTYPHPLQAPANSEMVLPASGGEGAVPQGGFSTNEEIIQEWQRMREDMLGKLADLSAQVKEQDRMAQKLLRGSTSQRCTCNCGSSNPNPGRDEADVGKRDEAGLTRIIPGGSHLGADDAIDSPTLRLAHEGSRRTLVKKSTSLIFFIEGPPNDWFQKMWVSVYGAVQWLNKLKEPKRQGWLADILQSKMFECLVVSIILGSVAFTIWSTNDTAMRVRSRASLSSEVSLYVELAFCTFFTFEVMARFAVHKLYFLVNDNWGWNWFDLLLVCAALTNLIYDQFLGYSIGNVTFLRAFRLMRVTRVLRMMRVVKFFRKLSQVLEALLTSVQAVAWVIVLLSSLFLAFALIFVQLVSQYLYETDALDECRKDNCKCDERDVLSCNPTEALVHYFGSVEKAMISLYMATTGGIDWTNLWDVILETGFWNAMFFLLFTFLFIFCVFNLLTGLFVNQALNSAQRDKDMKVFEQRTKEKEYVEELQQICDEADKDNDGSISRKEFNTMMQDDKVLFWLASIGLDISDAQVFFDIMQTTSGPSEDDEETPVPIDVFVQGCMRMKGGATSIDLQALMYKIQLMMERQMDLEKNQEESQAAIKNVEQILSCI